jgi:hypothetical protein
MNEPLRILVRLLGLVLFVASLVGIVFIVAVGPDQIGEGMGKNCRHGGHHGPSEWCTWQDALSIMQALPWICLVGGVLMLTMRRDWVGKDRNSEAAPSSGGRGSALGTIAVILAVVVTLPGVFIYRASYTVAHQTKMFKKIVRETPKPYLDGKPSAPAAPKAPAAPRGLGRGSLLRAEAFRKAMAEVRRAAPAGARLSGLRVAADRIDAEVLGRGRVVTLRKAWNAKLTVASKAAATDMDEPLIAFARLDTGAPQRIAVSLGRRGRDLDYLVLQDVVGLRWNGFLRDGKGQVTAPPDGRRVQ